LKSSSTASASLAIVRLHYDASVSVLSATSDMGQGARTVLAQIAGKELGVPPDRVVLTMGDTSIVPYDSSTSASRSTVFMGNAVIKACAEIRRRLQSIAAKGLGVDESAIEVLPGEVKTPKGTMSYAEVMQAGLGPPRGEVIGMGKNAAAVIDRSTPWVDVRSSGNSCARQWKSKLIRKQEWSTSLDWCWPAMSVKRSTQRRSRPRTKVPRSWVSALADGGTDTR
jgi:hypothetical protein